MNPKVSHLHPRLQAGGQEGHGKWRLCRVLRPPRTKDVNEPALCQATKPHTPSFLPTPELFPGVFSVRAYHERVPVGGEQAGAVAGAQARHGAVVRGPYQAVHVGVAARHGGGGPHGVVAQHVDGVVQPLQAVLDPALLLACEKESESSVSSRGAPQRRRRAQGWARGQRGARSPAARPAFSTPFLLSFCFSRFYFYFFLYIFFLQEWFCFLRDMFQTALRGRREHG